MRLTSCFFSFSFGGLGRDAKGGDPCQLECFTVDGVRSGEVLEEVGGWVGGLVG